MGKLGAIRVAVVGGALALVAAGIGGAPLGPSAGASATTAAPVVYAWGSNTYGQLGNGTTSDSDTPVEVSLLSGMSVTTVATGGNHGLALTSTGTVYAWGANTTGQLGNGTTISSDTLVKALLPAGVSVTAVAAGGDDSLALTSRGSVYAWGANSEGQLGNGTTTMSETPVEVSLPSGVSVTAAATGGVSAVALTSTGVVYAWGDNGAGRLGYGATSDTPVQVSLPSGVRATAVAASDAHSLVVTSTGAVYDWGWNPDGGLGNGTTTTSATPVKVLLPAGVSATGVAAGWTYSVAVTSAGAVYAWGGNEGGQLGDGTTTNSDTPVKVSLPAGVSATAVAAGGAGAASLALTSKGAIYAWGQGTAGDLGDGTTANSDTPVKVLLPAGVSATAVSASETDGLALTRAEVTPSTKRIYGATAEATAAKELEAEFPGATGKCPGTTGTRPVIVATATHFQDALSSQYLAGYLGTGTLLTPTMSLSSVTVAALKEEGITHVDLVGGSLAVTNTVEDQLESLSAYSCGGSIALTSHLRVTRISGTTQYETAEKIAETVPASDIKTAQFPTAYAGVNSTGGDGVYNDTAATGSSAPVGAATTAILASGTEFQDAEAASALGYATRLPILLTAPTTLTTAARDAIKALGIHQVIVMGGRLAVTNTVTDALEGLGVSVLRIAGKTYTDTATQFAKFVLNTPTTLGMGWKVDNGPATGEVAVARGNGYTDGLAGAVVTGRNKMPLLLTDSPTAVGNYLTAFLKATGQAIDGKSTDKISSLTVFGGTLAVTTAVIRQMETDIG